MNFKNINTKKMKVLIIVHLIAALMYVGGLIWTIAETLNYFIKDDPFNVWSIVLLGAGVVVAFANILIGIFKKW
jgi:hypothetical protein